MEFYNELLYIIFKKLDFDSLKNIITLNKNTQYLIKEILKRNYIINCDDKKQLGIKMSNKGYKIKLDLSNKRLYGIRRLKNIYDLNLSSCKFFFWSESHYLKNVKHLNISDTTISNNSQIKGGLFINQLSMLKDVYELNVSGCRHITDISCLKNHILHLVGCDNITNLNEISDSVKHLYLGGWYKLCYDKLDLSRIKHVYWFDNRDMGIIEIPNKIINMNVPLDSNYFKLSIGYLMNDKIDNNNILIKFIAIGDEEDLSLSDISLNDSDDDLSVSDLSLSDDDG